MWISWFWNILFLRPRISIRRSGGGKETDETSSNSSWGVVALMYLSYKGCLDVKWIAIENAAKSTLTDITNQGIHALNNTATHFQNDPSTTGSVGLPIAAAFGFMPGLVFGLRRG